MEDFKQNFAKILRNARTANEHTQESLAEKIGISGSAISQYEKKKKIPSVYVAKLLSDELGLTIDELCGADENNKYKKRIEDNPVLGLLTILQLFRFQVKVEGETIQITLPEASAEYSPQSILQFMTDYQMIQEFEKRSVVSYNGQEMVSKLYDHLTEKYSFLPGLPVYHIENIKPQPVTYLQTEPETTDAQTQ